MRKMLKAAALTTMAVTVVLAVVICTPVEPTIPRLQADSTTRYWQMEGGYRIAWTRVTASPPTRLPPIIVTHGGPGGYIHSSYVETFGRLAQLGHDVYLYDQVGSGRSDRLERPKDYSFSGHAEDLHEIVTRHLGVRHAILIGQSYGGQIVSYLAATHPDIVAAAVLTSPGGIQPTIFEDGEWVNPSKYPVPEDVEFIPPTDVSRAMGLASWGPRAIAMVALATTFNAKLVPDEEADGMLNTIAGRITRGMVCDPAAVQPEEGGGGMYSHGWSNWFGGVEGWRQGLRRSPAPTLVLQGQCDYLPYSAAFEHAALMPRGEYAFIEGAGHVIWWERPDEMIALIEEFLFRVQSSPVDPAPR